MKNFKKYLLVSAISLALVSCTTDDNNAVANNMTLQFTNTFKDQPIVLGHTAATSTTVNTSAKGQTHYFSELKYVISNIRLLKTDGKEVPYNVNDLDKGATVIDLSKPASLNYILSNIPAGEYKQIKFGLGIRNDLNTLNQVKFPQFYAAAGANDTKMMWEWGTGYRFTKIEGFYGTENQPLSIHTGSTVDEDENQKPIQGVDAYREIMLDLPTHATVGHRSPKIVIKADFDKLLSGKSHTIMLTTGTSGKDNATPNIHHAVQMQKFVDNIGGNGTSDINGMFSISSVK